MIRVCVKLVTYLFVDVVAFVVVVVSFSGTLVGFSYDARKERGIDAAVFSFIERNNIPPSQFRIFASDHGVLLDSLSNTGISADLLLSHSQAKTLLKSRSSSRLPLAKITSIVLAGFSKTDLFSLLPTLNTLKSTVKNSNVKVSAMFSLSCLESLNENEKKEMRRIMWFIQEVQSFIVVETQVDGELSMGDGFVDHVIQRAVTACKTLHHPAIPLVLNVKSSVVPSGVEISEFSERVMGAIEKHSEIKKRIAAIFVEILPIAEDVQKKRLSWEKEMIFPSSHRQLFNYEIHDTVTPVTNPTTTSPITVPSTNTSPGVITVPSTNPVTVLPTNPMTPITVPSTNPDTTPITAPGMNPLPTPITNAPLAPVTNPTNPVTSPTTVPVTYPVTNPVTTYPPAGGLPSTTPPVTNPGLVPSTTPPVTNPGTDTVSPAVSGQTWCVAKSGSLDSALQAALDYACGIGGADCSVIQVSGSCYNPNSLQAHASYAFNSYYQKNPVPTSCDFGGTATLVNINPSSGTCVYPSSSMTSGVNPASTFGGATGTGTGAGTSVGTGAGVGVAPGAVPGPGSVLNTNNSAGSSTVFGSDTPTGSNGHSIHHPACWMLFLSVVVTACITGSNIW